MKVYIYCSYQSSPVGFKLGTIQYNSSNKQYYIPTDTDIEPFVQKSFEEGLIKAVHGKIPESDKKILLIKKLQDTITDDKGNAIPIYMNFAFEFDDQDKFETFISNYRDNYSGDEEIAKALVKAVVPDRSVKDFALKINAPILNKFIENLLTKDEESISSITDVDKYKLIIELRSANDYSDKIAQLFGLDKYFLKREDKIYIYPVKKNSTQKLVLILGIVLVIVIILLILLWKN